MSIRPPLSAAISTWPLIVWQVTSPAAAPMRIFPETVLACTGPELSSRTSPEAVCGLHDEPGGTVTVTLRRGEPPLSSRSRSGAVINSRPASPTSALVNSRRVRSCPPAQGPARAAHSWKRPARASVRS
jgi:hypothetical protein